MRICVSKVNHIILTFEDTKNTHPEKPVFQSKGVFVSERFKINGTSSKYYVYI